MKQPREPRPDHLRRMVVILYFLLGIFGLLTIAASQYGGEAPFHLPLRQGLFLLLGTALLLGSAQIPFAWYQRNSGRFWLLSMGLLYLLPFFGVRLNGMRGWFSIGGIFLIQPSELAKAPYLLLLSVLASNGERSPCRRFLLMSGTGAAFCGIILLQPDFGTAAVYFAGLAVVLFIAGFRKSFLLLLAMAALPCTVLFLVKHEYAMARLAGYWNPDAHLYGAGWHIKQFQYTLAHGGLFGSEWGGALWSNAYLPLSHSDSAFAAIVESGGVAGGLLILGGFLAMVWLFRGMALAAESRTARFLIFSAGAVCAVQALLHIGVNTALLPPTGLTLPIFSYGGSSLFGTMAAFGMACSASRPGISTSSAREKKSANTVEF